MAWKIENLGGTKDGNNKNFTITQDAVPDTLLVIFQGVPLEAVASQPELMEAAYVPSGTNITLGLAPLSGQALWARYWFD